VDLWDHSWLQYVETERETKHPLVYDSRDENEYAQVLDPHTFDGVKQIHLQSKFLLQRHGHHQVYREDTETAIRGYGGELTIAFESQSRFSSFYFV
jgi:hypothetical protein